MLLLQPEPPTIRLHIGLFGPRPRYTKLGILLYIVGTAGFCDPSCFLPNDVRIHKNRVRCDASRFLFMDVYFIIFS